MSNNTLTTPVGIDAAINKIQVSLYEALTDRWNGNITGYGKAYKNNYKESTKLEWYNASDKDYQDVYYDDNSDATFFFIDEETNSSDDEIVFTSDVKCVFMVNLPKIITDDGRQDSQAQRDAVEALRDVSTQFKVVGIEKGFNTVFSGIETEKIKFNDIHPLHCFAVLMELNYYLTDKCT